MVILHEFALNLRIHIPLPSFIRPEVREYKLRPFLHVKLLIVVHQHLSAV